MSIVAVERALVILRLMGASAEGISVRAVARELGYSPAVVQKSLQALEIQGFAVQDPTTQLYHLGPVAIQVGLAGLRRIEVREVARPHLESLAMTSGETALLGIRQGDGAIYIDQVPSPHDVRMNVDLGERRPFNCTAVGKALLAWMSDDEVDRLADEGAFEQRTDRSVVDVDQLRAVLAGIRDTDLALDEEEFITGARCVCSPIRDHEGQVVAAVGIAGPADRVLQRQDEIAAEVRAVAERISGAIGNQKSTNRASA